MQKQLNADKGWNYGLKGRELKNTIKTEEQFWMVTIVSSDAKVLIFENICQRIYS